jgi:hypothetical protein
MPRNPREMIMLAERRFPVRIRIGVAPEGLGRRDTLMTAVGGSARSNRPYSGPGWTVGIEDGASRRWSYARCCASVGWQSFGRASGVQRLGWWLAPSTRSLAPMERRMGSPGIGCRMVFLADGVSIRGRGSPPTGSGVPAAGPLIIHSQTGAARLGAGVIRSRQIRSPNYLRTW